MFDCSFWSHSTELLASSSGCVARIVLLQSTTNASENKMRREPVGFSLSSFEGQRASDHHHLIFLLVAIHHCSLCTSCFHPCYIAPHLYPPSLRGCVFFWLFFHHADVQARIFPLQLAAPTTQTYVRHVLIFLADRLTSASKLAPFNIQTSVNSTQTNNKSQYFKMYQICSLQIFESVSYWGMYMCAL